MWTFKGYRNTWSVYILTEIICTWYMVTTTSLNAINLVTPNETFNIVWNLKPNIGHKFKKIKCKPVYLWFDMTFTKYDTLFHLVKLVSVYPVPCYVIEINTISMDVTLNGWINYIMNLNAWQSMNGKEKVRAIYKRIAGNLQAAGINKLSD